MTHFSARFAVGIGAAVALVLAPATLLQVTGQERSECRSVDALLEAERFDPDSEIVTEGERPSRLEKGRLVAFVKPKRGRPGVVYSVVRLQRIAHALVQPHAALPGGLEPDLHEPRSIDAGSAVLPANFAYEMSRSRLRITASFMVHGGEPIKSPWWARLRASLDSLVHGPQPITLFVASTRAHQADQEKAEQRLESFMRNAWQVYEDACKAPTGTARIAVPRRESAVLGS